MANKYIAKYEIADGVYRGGKEKYRTHKDTRNIEADNDETAVIFTLIDMIRYVENISALESLNNTITLKELKTIDGRVLEQKVLARGLDERIQFNSDGHIFFEDLHFLKLLRLFYKKEIK